jgi:hypothetical protein
MAARKKRTIIEEQLPDTGSGEEQDEITAFDVALESVEDLETLTDVMEQYGQTGKLLKVYRESGEFCYQSDTVDEAFIQKHFGGGGYRIRLFLNGKYKKTIPISCAAPIVENGNGNGNGNSSDHHRDFLEKLVLAQIASGGGSNKAPSITELTTALANLDGLRGKQESAMDLFQKGVSFAKEIFDMKTPGSGDWKSELISAAKDALPVVGGIIASRSGVPAMPTKDPNALVTATPEQQVEAIKQGLVYLKKQCLKGVDPKLIVDWVDNNAEDYQPLIHNVLNLPFEKFVEIDAEIGNEPFKQWFTGLFDGLRSAFVTVDTVDMDSAGESGDSDDIGNDGNTGTHPKRKGK